MRIGVKSYYDPPFIEYFKTKADFIEIMASSSDNFDFLKGVKIPIIIHSMHESFEVNASDKEKEAFNLEAFNFAIKLADSCKSDKIILHPGLIQNPNCSMEQSSKLLNVLTDKRILIENNNAMNLKGRTSFFSSPKQIVPFLQNTGKDFCLDINHAINYALSQDLDYISVLKELIALKPAHFHLGGQKFSPYKEHQDFSDSDVDLEKVFSILPKDADITLEVTKSIEKTDKDLELIRKVISKL
ncbi:sugar phosphate isomerase/epimerase family protein [Nanoarchaeota archaeon]